MPKESTILLKAVQAVLAALDTCDLGDEELQITVESQVSPPAVTKADKTIEVALAREMPILKTQEERYILGVVLEPLKEMGMTDTQDDTYSAAEVRSAAHKFMEDFATVGLQHQVNVTGKVKILESWVAREDAVIDGEAVKAGTWLMGLRVVDDGIWKRIKDGSITGLSIGGIAQRTPLLVAQN